MAKIQDVIRFQLVVRVDDHMARADVPILGNHEIERHDRFGIGFGWITHPDPERAIALRHRELAYARRAWHRSVGIQHATAISAELQAMIGTLDPIAQVLPHMQGSKAMRTTIEQGNGCTIASAEQQYRLIEQATMKELSGLQLACPRCLIPSVAKVTHLRPSRRWSLGAMQTQPCSMRQGAGCNDSPRQAPCMHTPVSGSKWAPWP